MNFSYTLKPNRLIHTSSTTDLAIQKPYFTIFNAPSTKTLPVTPQNLERESKMKKTDYKLFREKELIDQEEPLSCFQLITLSPPSPFVTIIDLNKIEFSALSYPIRQLVGYAKSMFDANLERRAIGKSFNLLKLIELLAENYNATSYHNFTHAFSVLQVYLTPFSCCTSATTDQTC